MKEQRAREDTIRMRLFLGIPITGEALEEAKRIIPALGSQTGKITPISNLHMTLAFLGETPEEKLKTIDDGVKNVVKAADAFCVSLEGLDSFPKSGILFLAARDSEGKLNMLAAGIRKTLEREGFRLDPRKFKPHITLKRRCSEEEICRLCKNIQVAPKELWVREVSLYQSQLTPAGPQYQICRSYQLAKNK